MELLVVISIIVVLAALGIQGWRVVGENQRRSQARVQLGLLESALEDYAADHGGEYPLYPEPTAKGGTAEIFDALFAEPAREGSPVYLAELAPDNDTQGWLNGQTGRQGLSIFDPWGGEFIYRTQDPSNPDQPIASNPGFDLWSSGPDHSTRPGSAGNLDRQDPANLDDIGSGR
ncbi:hypothetical protein Hsar01_02981 [Haloferula sargassicola]|uniref:Type II secretion system protein n=2 Tax=Haloferula sargassicola TaxID=490096 RepID=A0ABP9UQM6_9BACT